jgi:hypothetical protein
LRTIVPAFASSGSRTSWPRPAHLRGDELRLGRGGRSVDLCPAAGEVEREEVGELGDRVGLRPAAVDRARLEDRLALLPLVLLGEHVVIAHDDQAAVAPADETERPGGGGEVPDGDAARRGTEPAALAGGDELARLDDVGRQPLVGGRHERDRIDLVRVDLHHDVHPNGGLAGGPPARVPLARRHADDVLEAEARRAALGRRRLRGDGEEELVLGLLLRGVEAFAVDVHRGH